MPRKPNTALIYRRVPAFLRGLREQADLTQRDLATKIGKTQSWVARCETGDRRIDVAEWVEWAIGCGVEPAAALAELSAGRRASND